MHKMEMPSTQFKPALKLYLGLLTLLILSCSSNSSYITSTDSSDNATAQSNILKDTILSRKCIADLKNQVLNCVDVSRPNYLVNYRKYFYPPSVKWIKQTYPDDISEDEIMQMIFDELRKSIKEKGTKMKRLHYKINEPITIFTAENVIFSKVSFTTTFESNTSHAVNSRLLGISKNSGKNWQFIEHDNDKDYDSDLRDILEIEFSSEVASQIPSK